MESSSEDVVEAALGQLHKLIGERTESDIILDEGLRLKRAVHGLM